jgi:hypothetical protein
LARRKLRSTPVAKFIAGERTFYARDYAKKLAAEMAAPQMESPPLVP